MKKDTSTEEKIRQAAREVFISKGYDGCSTREIANAAGLNVALVNYYFRSKKQLFEAIFKSTMEEFMLVAKETFMMDQPLEMKVRIFIEKEYEFMTKHPHIPGFIISELSRCDSNENENTLIQFIMETGILETMRQEQENGNMRKLDFVSVMLIMMSNCHFPFMAKSFIQEMHQMDDEKYAQQIVLHKQYVTEMIVNYLFLRK